MNHEPKNRRYIAAAAAASVIAMAMAPLIGTMTEYIKGPLQDAAHKSVVDITGKKRNHVELTSRQSNS